jgi:hypothetical protein
LPVNGIWALVSGGAVAIFLFSLAATWITKKYSISGQAEKVNLPIKPSFTRIIFLAAIVWPLIYFLFGYLVAWQFKEVRILYTGSAHMDSFLSLMKDNVASGLYFFQIFRGILWVLIGLLILNMSRGSTTFKGVTLGLLFAVLGSSGLLLPNPIMPAMVRLAHGIETSTSDFLWGIIIAWYLGQPGSGKQSGVVQS